MKISRLLALLLFVFAICVSCEKDDKEPKTIPVILTQPQDIIVSVGDTDDTNKLSVIANDEDGDMLTYQWQNRVDEEWLDIEGGNLADYVPDKSKVGAFEYRVIVSDSENNVVSEIATVSVEGPYVIVKFIGNGHEVGNTLTVPTIRPGGSTNLTERPPLNIIADAPAFTMPQDGESTEWIAFTKQNEDYYWKPENGVTYDLYLAIVIGELDACYRQEFVFDNSTLPQEIVMDLRELTRVEL